MEYRKPESGGYRGSEEKPESLGARIASYGALILLFAIAGAMLMGVTTCVRVRAIARYHRHDPERSDDRIRAVRDGAGMMVLAGAAGGAGVAVFVLVFNALKDGHGRRR